MKKVYYLLTILIIILGIGFWVFQNQEKQQVIGGDTDTEGCLVSAGYRYCPTTEKCQRMWEEYCPEYKDEFRPKDFLECESAEGLIMESYPRQCKYGDETFKEVIDSPEYFLNLKENQKIESPFTLTGDIPGTWFFEGDFPVIITNWDGLIIAEGIAKAQSDWMTEDMVPFSVTLEFEKPEYKNNGSIILKKNNPSGLPEYDDTIEIPILFK